MYQLCSWWKGRSREFFIEFARGGEALFRLPPLSIRRERNSLLEKARLSEESPAISLLCQGIPSADKAEFLEVLDIQGGEVAHPVVAQGERQSCVNDMPEPGAC